MLESKLLKLSNPVMCMDRSPIAGLTVQLQHQLLSCRNICLNPIKQSSTSSKLNPSETDNFNDELFTSKLSNESQNASSKMMVSLKYFYCNIYITLNSYGILKFKFNGY